MWLDCGESRNNVLIQNFTQHNDATTAIDRAHVHNANVGRFHVLRPPIVLRATVDNIPAQVVDRNHLRRHTSFPDNWPRYLPPISCSNDMQIADIRECADYRGPLQYGANFGFISRSVKGVQFERVERGIGTKTWIRPCKVAHELKFAEFVPVG